MTLPLGVDHDITSLLGHGQRHYHEVWTMTLRHY